MSMIWVIANNKEEDGSFPTYKFYKNAFHRNEIDIYCAKQNDDFSFLKKEDIVFMRTRDENINSRVSEAQATIGFASTLESPTTNYLTHDKEFVKKLLRKNGIPFPETINLKHVVDGGKYFVKPRFGENSAGIDENSVCYLRSQVVEKYNSLSKVGIEPIIEEYINGYDTTSSIIFSPEHHEIKVYSAFTHANNSLGIQTDETKKNFGFHAFKCSDESIDNVARKVFGAVSAKHHLRVDFRVCNHTPYVIDINMIPGLAPDGYMSMCMKSHGIEYYDFVRMVVNSAF